MFSVFDCDPCDPDPDTDTDPNGPEISLQQNRQITRDGS